MPSYRTMVAVPRMTPDEYGSLVAQLRRSNPSSSPVLLERDPDGSFRLFHAQEPAEIQPSDSLAISITVDVDDPLAAAATTTALFALTMDSAGMRTHFPSVVQVTQDLA